MFYPHGSQATRGTPPVGPKTVSKPTNPESSPPDQIKTPKNFIPLGFPGQGCLRAAHLEGPRLRSCLPYKSSVKLYCYAKESAQRSQRTPLFRRDRSVAAAAGWETPGLGIGQTGFRSCCFGGIEIVRPVQQPQATACSGSEPVAVW